MLRVYIKSNCKFKMAYIALTQVKGGNTQWFKLSDHRLLIEFQVSCPL